MAWLIATRWSCSTSCCSGRTPTRGRLHCVDAPVVDNYCSVSVHATVACSDAPHTTQHILYSTTQVYTHTTQVLGRGRPHATLAPRAAHGCPNAPALEVRPAHGRVGRHAPLHGNAHGVMQCMSPCAIPPPQSTAAAGAPWHHTPPSNHVWESSRCLVHAHRHQCLLHCTVHAHTPACVLPRQPPLCAG